MDYKKLIKSRTVRIKLMRILSFVPDAWMVQLQYRLKTGRKLNLKNPQRYTEKLQWYKLNYRDPLMAKCVDKYEVREYVKQVGLENILNPIYGVYSSPEEVDWDQLPDQFVAKDTLGGGGNDVLICKDKSKLNKAEFYEFLARWTQPVKGKHPGREWVYDNAKHRILIEKYIPSSPQDGGLIDYKFFCFSGKAKFLYVIADRDLGNGAGLGIFDKEFSRLPYERADERPLKRDIQRPINYEQMIECAEKLAKPFPHARIDLYNQNGCIVFGEITFFDGSGYMKFEPDGFDEMMGKKFEKCGDK
ncbi:ATP-grasp fold amidoligase family protein [Allofournierella massiliensis]|uniref:ATP-grasp fold amidoligase family protein n=1 Tax=Allofournierella massiliensis TaxID=1650663 RepID=UPI00356AA7EE